jgi:hypothetical protein
VKGHPREARGACPPLPLVRGLWPGSATVRRRGRGDRPGGGGVARVRGGVVVGGRRGGEGGSHSLGDG